MARIRRKACRCLVYIVADIALRIRYYSRYAIAPPYTGLLNHTLTSAGKNTLRTWLLRPTSDLATLHARHTAIAYFMAGGRAAVADEIRDSLRHVRNVPRIMDRMKMGVKAGDFQAILKVCSCVCVHV